VPNVEILYRRPDCEHTTYRRASSRGRSWRGAQTLIPSWEKHGGTAELSSSASRRSIGNFSTADIGMSPL
jgi:hypothetical protein